MDTGWIALALAVLALIAATPYVTRQRRKATIDLEDSTLAVAQREIQIEREARLAGEERCNQRIAELERSHEARLGELRGQVSTLTDQFAHTVAEHVATRLDGRNGPAPR